MTDYDYIIMPRALQKMRTFYTNVARKYRHTYSCEDMERNIAEAVFGVYGIEKTLLRRQPTIARWQGRYMANAGKWYYAYKIEGFTILIMDACHVQNMK